jgi:hypothetical protein
MSVGRGAGNRMLSLIPAGAAADPASDVAKYLDGYITILPMLNDLTAPMSERARIFSALQHVSW